MLLEISSELALPLLGGAQPVIPPNLYFMNIIAWGPQVNSHMVPTQNAALSDLWYQWPIKPDSAAKNNHISLLLEYKGLVKKELSYNCIYKLK